MSQQQLTVTNQDTTPTFVRGTQESVLDLTMCPTRCADMVQKWEILEEETLSWHKLIYFVLAERNPTAPIRKELPRGWKVTETAMGRFRESLAGHVGDAVGRTTALSAGQLTDCVTKACNAAFRNKKALSGNRTPVYWWSAEIGQLRKSCLVARRRSTKANKRASSEEERSRRWEEYKESRKTLRKAIKQAKGMSWGRLIEDLNRDTFGRAYKIVVDKTRPRATIDEETQLGIAKGLFPRVEPVNWGAPRGPLTPHRPSVWKN